MSRISQMRTARPNALPVPAVEHQVGSEDEEIKEFERQI